MNSIPFPAQSSILSDDGLAELLLSDYELAPPVRCRFFRQGDNDIYLVTSAGSRGFFLRVSVHGRHSGQEVEAEAQVLECLVHQGVPVPRPVRGRDGKYARELSAMEGRRYAVLFGAVSGEPPSYAITEEQARAYGRVVARVHDALDSLPAKYQRPAIDLRFLISDALEAIAPALRHRVDDLRYVLDVTEAARQKLEALPVTFPHYGLIHGDLHKRNALVDERGRLAIIDWDRLGYGWRAYDLSVLRWSVGPAVGPEGIGEPRASRVWEAYLEGYGVLRSMTEQELQAIPWFVAARHLWTIGKEVDDALHRHVGLSHLTERFWDDRLEKLRSWVGDNGLMP
jgi:Ser/Thr protein kinase RdoA (MazF antagonist)